MGYDAIRNLPEEERERDRKVIDAAFQESSDKIREIGERKKQHLTSLGSEDTSPVS